MVIEASELTADESAMTGETDPVKKNILSYCIEKRNSIIEEGAKVFSIFFNFFINYVNILI